MVLVGLDVIGILVTQKQTESEENACLAIVSAMLSELSAVVGHYYPVDLLQLKC